MQAYDCRRIQCILSLIDTPALAMGDVLGSSPLLILYRGLSPPLVAATENDRFRYLLFFTARIFARERNNTECMCTIPADAASRSPGVTNLIRSVSARNFIFFFSSLYFFGEIEFSLSPHSPFLFPPPNQPSSLPSQALIQTDFV